MISVAEGSNETTRTDLSLGPRHPGAVRSRGSLGHTRVAETSRDAGRPVSGERLGLEGVVLLLCDRAGLEELLRLGDLVSRVTAARDPTDVVLLLGVGGLRPGDRPFRHPLRTGDQVDEDRDERQQEQEDNPYRLPETAQLVVAEQVA